MRCRLCHWCGLRVSGPGAISRLSAMQTHALIMHNQLGHVARTDIRKLSGFGWTNINVKNRRRKIRISTLTRDGSRICANERSDDDNYRPHLYSRRLIALWRSRIISMPRVWMAAIPMEHDALDPTGIYGGRFANVCKAVCVNFGRHKQMRSRHIYTEHGFLRLALYSNIQQESGVCRRTEKRNVANSNVTKSNVYDGTRYPCRSYTTLDEFMCCNTWEDAWLKYIIQTCALRCLPQPHRGQTRNHFALNYRPFLSRSTTPSTPFDSEHRRFLFVIHILK